MRTAVQIWRSQNKNYKNLGKTGRVVTKTRIIEAPEGFKGPYWIVMVETAEGQRVVGQWADVKEPKIGDMVVGVLRRLQEEDRESVIEYGVKWQRQ